MKGTLTQYVALGVMLMLLVLIVSLLPEQKGSHSMGQHEKATTVSKLTISTGSKPVRPD
jgi:hypothetical protein